MSKRTFVIIGGGLAAATAVATLREEGFDGRIVVVTEEPHVPYERPPLSKGYLRGESTASDAYVHPLSFYEHNDIELRTQARVTSLDASASEVRVADETTLPFDALLLATGAAARVPPILGAELEGVLTLRTLDDADRLRARALASDRIVVIGSGWIGSEVGASLRSIGKDVVMVSPEQVPLERIVGTTIGGTFRALHRDHGVDLRFGTSIAEIRGAGRAEAVVTSDGEAIECDLVVLGVGAAPRDELAHRAGIETGDGVLADVHLRTSAANIFAAGDVASAPNDAVGARLRVEHWANAKEQGRIAALGMLGRPARNDKLPFFFSDQYDLGLEYVGHVTGTEDVVVRGDLAGREFIAFWLHEGRIVAGMNVNVWDVKQSVEALIGSRAVVDAARLADPNVPLNEVLGAELSRS